jgi:protein-S-isoprenylcysteine O-methyltransferase Ste14
MSQRRWSQWIGWKKRGKWINLVAVIDRQTVVYIFDGLWIFWLGYWIFRAFGNKRSVYTQGRGFRLLYIAVVVVGAVVAKNYGLLPRIRFYYETIWTQVLGILLCVAGMALAIWARRILGTNWSGIVTLKENHELITSGPYRFVRHPIYSGLLLAILGTIVAMEPFLGGFLVFGISIISLRLKSLLEERIMLRTFPDQYPDYMRRVRALIPYIW